MKYTQLLITAVPSGMHRPNVNIAEVTLVKFSTPTVQILTFKTPWEFIGIYRDRLFQLNIPSLKYRLLRGDMIEVFKIIHSINDATEDEVILLRHLCCGLF